MGHARFSRRARALDQSHGIKLHVCDLDFEFVARMRGGAGSSTSAGARSSADPFVLVFLHNTCSRVHAAMPLSTAPAARVSDALVMLNAMGDCPKDVQMIVCDSGAAGFGVVSNATALAAGAAAAKVRAAANRKAAVEAPCHGGSAARGARGA